MKTPAPLVFFDIAGPDDEAQRRFYAEVFGWSAGPTGAIAAPVDGAMLRGTLRTDPAEKVLYIGVDDIAATLADVERHGGATLAPRFEVPGVVVLGLFTDPAGNRLGLVELRDGQPRVP
jgi:uncharacterized protein